MPAITKPNQHFDVSTWTGDGSQTKSITGVNFQPDLVWNKIRSGTTQAIGSFDSIRGTTGQCLDTSATTAEGTWNGAASSDYGYVSSFDTNGFSMNDGAVATTGGYVNYSARTYVAWQWKAGQGTTSNITAGQYSTSPNVPSRASTVSVNATAGFSIVSYAGQTNTPATIGHGLGVAPSFIITKNRTTATYDGDVWHSALLGTQYLVLNSTANAGSNANAWNSTIPTSTVFSVGQFGGTCGLTGDNMIAWVWSEIAGFSKFGSYTGNGDPNGTFIYTGFRPRFVMVKNTTTGGAGYDWFIYDTSRDTYNASTKELEANLSAVEDDYALQMDILSNGFKWRASGAGGNGSGDTYIYACWAENPLKYANAR